MRRIRVFLLVIVGMMSLAVLPARSSQPLETVTRQETGASNGIQTPVPTSSPTFVPLPTQTTVQLQPTIATVHGGWTEEATRGAAGTLLDQAEVLVPLGSGVSAPPGRLEFGPVLTQYVVTLADGSMGIADTSGTIVASLRTGVHPIWSLQGLVLLYGSGSTVATWDAESGQIFIGGAPSERAVADVPAGWLDSRYYYQRTFPDSPGRSRSVRQPGMAPTTSCSGAARRSIRWGSGRW
jgi:hypothetical protein